MLLLQYYFLYVRHGASLAQHMGKRGRVFGHLAYKLHPTISIARRGNPNPYSNGKPIIREGGYLAGYLIPSILDIRFHPMSGIP
ncbi:hypothetical protein COCNU_10G000870 [Cocos nucifera]|uniref:Uncharacterized protein n=1 Tax=Cocos nucifera TaxID=13894 RepID=A0A8K0N7S7_COCNU|nr:hypothetical protein COCNU_10G000870 [Cocos nucifera]